MAFHAFRTNFGQPSSRLTSENMMEVIGRKHSFQASRRLPKGLTPFRRGSRPFRTGVPTSSKRSQTFWKKRQTFWKRRRTFSKRCSDLSKRPRTLSKRCSDPFEEAPDLFQEVSGPFRRGVSDLKGFLSPAQAGSQVCREPSVPPAEGRGLRFLRRLTPTVVAR
jgi:hypothetical protein